MISYEGVDCYISRDFSEEKRYNLMILDLDGTLINRANSKNAEYPDDNPTNFVFLNNVFNVLDEYKEKNYVIFIVTNQNWGSKYDDSINAKMQNILNEIHQNLDWVPHLLVIKGNNTKYRKPSSNILEIINFVLSKKSSEKFKIKKVLVCGDAIGNDEYPPYRWSSVDKDLSINIANETPNFNVSFYRPLDLFPSNRDQIMNEINEDIIILVGNPGSGKSTCGRELATKGYVHIEKDNFTDSKFIKEINNNLKKNKKIVIDKTNAKKEHREIFIEMAKNYKKSVAILWLTINGQSFNALRENPVSRVVYNTYSKWFEIPTENETKVYKLN